MEYEFRASAAGALAIACYRTVAASGVFERRGSGRAAVAQKLRAAARLVVLPDGCRGDREHVQRAQEAAVRLVLPPDRPLALPARLAGLIHAPGIARPRVGVRRHRVAILHPALG